jgi:hypothetical protein
MQTINTNDLNSEYTEWVKQNGNGRNRQDQRFSQHIHNTYNLENIKLKDDGFYIENAEKFYLCIMQSLICLEVKFIKTEKAEQEA